MNRSTADLKDRLDAARAHDEAFKLNWSIVRDWSEEERYNLDIPRAKAQGLYIAITERRTGVMTWIRNYW